VGRGGKRRRVIFLSINKKSHEEEKGISFHITDSKKGKEKRGEGGEKKVRPRTPNLSIVDKEGTASLKDKKKGRKKGPTFKSLTFLGLWCGKKEKKGEKKKKVLLSLPCAPRLCRGEIITGEKKKREKKKDENQP